MTEKLPDQVKPAEGTARALIEAAIEIFGNAGYAAASTREIAAKAGTNVASIAYHFGGKEGLRLACAREFAARMQGVMMALPAEDPPTPEAAHVAIRALLSHVAPQMIGNPQMRAMISFVLREVAENGPGAQVIYDILIHPMHRRFCRLWGIATGQEPESAAVRLTVFTAIGQILYFRIGASIVTRRMGWEAIGPDEVAQITEVLLRNIEAILAVTKGEGR